MSCLRDGDKLENQRPALIAERSSMVRIGSVMACHVGDLNDQNCHLRDRTRKVARALVTCRLATNLKRARVDDIGWAALDEVHHVVKGGTKIKLIAVLFHIANVRRADAVFQAQ